MFVPVVVHSGHGAISRTPACCFGARFETLYRWWQPRALDLPRRDAMTAAAVPGVDPAAFVLRHVMLIPGLLVAVALTLHPLGLDERISGWFFDAQSAGFPARAWPALELLGHRLAKSALLALWLVLLATACTAQAVGWLRGRRGLLWTTVIAMAVGPLLVVLLKGINSHHCPWDLKQFGGIADYAADWFVPAADAGRCFPSGHAAGGFSLLALYFAGLASGQRALARVGLTAALATGALFSVIRITQGAHFLSHNLWSAAITWSAAAIVFTPLLVARAGGRPTIQAF
jgi:membrane-associated PAP2 superfamily phosphatase